METHSQQTTNVNGYSDSDTAPDARDFLGSRYLSKDDLDGPMVVYLQNVRPELLPDARRRKLVAEFRNEEKGCRCERCASRSVLKAGGPASWSWTALILLLEAKSPETRKASVDSLRGSFRQAGVTLTAYDGGIIRTSLLQRPPSSSEIHCARKALRLCA